MSWCTCGRVGMFNVVSCIRVCFAHIILLANQPHTSTPNTSTPPPPTPNPYPHPPPHSPLHRCGRRGGYFELTNGSKPLHDMMYKLSSINLCSNTGGQIAMATIMHPPKPGDPSFMLWSEEMVKQLKSLQERARLVVDAMRKLKGVTCTDSDVRGWCVCVY